jgi:hypothetical protein
MDAFDADFPSTGVGPADSDESLFGDTRVGIPGFSQKQPSAPKPHILAPQANEWENNQQEVEVVKSRRTGLVLLFILALLLVALIALGLAAWSVFSGGDPLPETDAGASTEADAGTDGDLAGTPDSTILPPPTTVNPNLLDVLVTEDPFVCDNVLRPFAQLSGATPNEEIAFNSPQTANLTSGTAEADGTLPIRWSCTPDQAGTTWELTATGVTSGKSATISFTGALESAAAPADPGTAPAEGTLAVELLEDPFVCNDEARVFGNLTGADAGEEIAFTSPQATGIKNGVADAAGNLSFRWVCSPDQAGTVWELTATGVTSAKTVSFSFTGS